MVIQKTTNPFRITHHPRYEKQCISYSKIIPLALAAIAFLASALIAATFVTHFSICPSLAILIIPIGISMAVYLLCTAALKIALFFRKSQPQNKAPIVKTLQALLNSMEDIRARFQEFDHPLKQKKYSVFLSQLSAHFKSTFAPIETCMQNLNQMQHSSLKEPTQKTLCALQNQTTINPRDRYQNQFLNTFRMALKNPAFKNSTEPTDLYCQTLLKHLAFSMFTGIKLHDYYQEIFQELVPNATVPFISLKTISLIMGQDNKTIHHAPPKLTCPEVKKLRKTFQNTAGWDYDPERFNLPYVRSKIVFKFLDHSEKTLLYLRHCSPTIEKELPTAIGKPLDIQTVEIAPEFEAFLSYLDQQQKHFLYISHQRTQYVEGERNTTLSSLSDTHKSLIFVVLPMGDDTLFNAEFPNIQKLKIAIKDAFAQQIHGVALPFSQPDSSEFQQLLIDVSNLLDMVHDLYFDGKEILDITKKKVFLLLFITYLKIHLQIKYKADYTVSACKENIDRGNASAGIQEIILALLSSKENDPQYLQNLRIATAGPAFMAKKQEIQRKRQRLLEIVLTHLSSLSDTQKQLIRDKTFAIWHLEQITLTTNL